MKLKNPKQGDIVLIPFPFTDLSSSKIRPALVLAESGENITLAFLTSVYRKTESSIAVKASKMNGLKEHSFIIVSKLATLDRKSIVGRIGQLELSDLKKVKRVLRIYLKI